MGENMYDKRDFRKLLRLRVYLSLFSVRKNAAVIFCGIILTFIIYHSKWYSIKTTVTPYLVALIYTPLYIFSQVRLMVPLVPYVTTRVKLLDRLKLAITDIIISSSLWGLFLSIIQICLTKNICILDIKRLILAILYFMTVTGIVHVIYISTKNASISFSITLILLMTDYYMSVFKNFMGVQGVILYTVFAGKSFFKSCITILIINSILLIYRLYLCYYNMDIIEWEIK